VLSTGYAAAGDRDLPPLPEEKLKELPIGGVAYYESLRAIGRLPKVPDLPPPPPVLGLILDPSVQYNADATSDANQDVEPAIATLNYNGQASTVIVSIKYVDIGGGVMGPRNYFSMTTDFANFTRAQMPMPASGYNRSGDPYVAGYGTTMYAVGVVNNGATTLTPNAIGLWRSTNGGTCWPGCMASDAPVLIVNNDTNWYLDKPAINVNQSTNVLGGRLYVAYARVNNGNPFLTELHLARSSNGGQSFDSDIVLVVGRRTGAQVMSTPDGTGKIYVVYTDIDNRQLRMANAQDNFSGGLSFLSDEAVTGTRNLIRLTDPNLNGGVLAASFASAKLNSVSGRIDVVWHERESADPNANTDVFMTSKVPGGAWLDPFPVVFNSARDQFMPALAVQPFGNVLITFYNRYDDPQNMWYRNYFVYYNDLGTRLQGDTMMTINNYDPREQPTIAGFLGDYQDVGNWTFSTGNRWNSVWIRTFPSNTVVTGIQ
jgi:hypothetical protein